MVGLDFPETVPATDAEMVTVVEGEPVEERVTRGDIVPELHAEPEGDAEVVPDTDGDPEVEEEPVLVAQCEGVVVGVFDLAADPQAVLDITDVRDIVPDVVGDADSQPEIVGLVLTVAVGRAEADVELVVDTEGVVEVVGEGDNDSDAEADDECVADGQDVVLSDGDVVVDTLVQEDPEKLDDGVTDGDEDLLAESV